jgi:hypothetical protein
VQSPRGSHPGSVQINKGQIFRKIVTKRVFEVRAHNLRQILGLSEEFSHHDEHSSIAAVAV